MSNLEHFRVFSFVRLNFPICLRSVRICCLLLANLEVCFVCVCELEPMNKLTNQRDNFPAHRGRQDSLSANPMRNRVKVDRSAAYRRAPVNSTALVNLLFTCFPLPPLRESRRQASEGGQRETDRHTESKSGPIQPLLVAEQVAKPQVPERRMVIK